MMNQTQLTGILEELQHALHPQLLAPNLCLLRYSNQRHLQKPMV